MLTLAEKITVINQVIIYIKLEKQIYMCNAIEKVTGKRALKAIPELKKYKPEGKIDDGAWFYGVEDKHKRLEILEKLKEELNEQH